MAYSDDIQNLGADHHWKFDGDSLDAVGSANGTDTSITHTGSAIAEDATNCMTVNAVGDRVSIPTTTTINNSAQTRKAVGGWFMADSIQTPPKRIYGEGNTTTAYQIVLAYGNNVMFEVVEPTNFDLQIYGGVLQPNRAYHIYTSFEGNGFGNIAKLFIDGVEQTNASPTDRQPDTADIDIRGVGEFGDPAGTVGVGELNILLTACTDADYNHWFAIDGADAVLTDTEIREELFEKGALPDIIITTDTEANMQIDLDSYADSLRADAPLCIRVEPLSGGGDFTLDADNITFSPLASIHVQYTGTDTLVWKNSNGGDASIGSTPGGGTINFSNPQTLTITVKDAADNSAIENARVYIEADTGGLLTAGTEIMSALTNASGIATVSFDYISDQPIVGYVRKGSAAPYYKQGTLPALLTSTPLNEIILLVGDE